jgi:FkbM family methyltransferase
LAVEVFVWEGRTVNLLERRVDRIDPRLSVTLRVLKKHVTHDPKCDVIRRFVRRSESVADVGANRGVYTWLLSRAVGDTGRVHAFEPYPANVDRLTSVAGGRRNVTVHPVALSDCAGEATLRVPSFHDRQIDALASLRPNVGAGFVPVPISTRPLDEVLPPNRHALSFIKCDVEGHEDEVVSGAWQTIVRHHPVLVIEIEQRHRAAPVADLVGRLRDGGYDCFFIAENGIRPYAEFDIERDQLRFLTGDFVPHAMPKGYVGDFLFVPTRG